MTEATATHGTIDPGAAEIDHSWGWFLFLGIVFIIMGSIAILLPMVSTYAISLIFGVTLTVTGIVRVIQAFRASKWRGFLLNLLLGLIHLIGGVYIWFNPAAGALVITLTLSWILMAHGVAEIILAFRVRPDSGWGWLLVSGIVGVIASIWLILRIPVAGIFMPGVILGIALLFEGWAFIAIALATRRKPAAA